VARTAPLNPRRRLTLQIVVGVIVVAVIAAIVLGFGLGSHPRPGGNAAKTPAAASVTGEIAAVPASAFDEIGAGTAKLAPRNVADAPALASGGKPLVLYVGGEFCPYCAAERWPLAVALSRFGTLKGLGETTSASAPEVYPDTATLSFHGASLTSDHIALTAKEVFDRDHNALDTLTGDEQKVLDTYDAPPYSQSAGTIPFLNVGGRWLVIGAQFDPAVLKGKTHAQIAAALSDPKSPIAQAVVGTANVLTVSICDQTGGQPASVCTSPGVKAAAAAMGVQN
jgi:hypothetical protein